MNITIYSIPHTGTRFVESLFRLHGIRTSRRHVGHKLAHDDGLKVVPVRNPYDCYVSHCHRHPGRLTDAEFVALWGRMIWKSEGALFFPLDTKDRNGLIRHALRKVGYDGEIKDFEWKAINTSTHDNVFPEHMKLALSFAYEWYLERTNNAYSDFSERQDR